MKTTRMEFSILNKEEEIPYLSWLEDFGTDCHISGVMNSYCEVATSIGVMPLYLIINNNENCCVARLFVFCSIYSEVFVLTPSLTISKGEVVFSP